MDNDSFWLVWSPAGHCPKFRHGSESSAVTEAERLATTNPGQEFYVVKAISLSVTHKPVSTTKLVDSIPFCW